MSVAGLELLVTKACEMQSLSSWVASSGCGTSRELEGVPESPGRQVCTVPGVSLIQIVHEGFPGIWEGGGMWVAQSSASCGHHQEGGLGSPEFINRGYRWWPGGVRPIEASPDPS